MVVLIDANIILDVLEQRSPFYDNSLKILTECAAREVKGIVAIHSVANIFFILRKQYSNSERRKLLYGILDFLYVGNIDHVNVKKHCCVRILSILRTACRMSVQRKLTQTILLPETYKILNKQM